MVLWNILTLHTCLLMKYNPIDINRGLCSLKNPVVREKHKKSYGYSLELLFAELNNLVVSRWQVCDNPLVTKVWGQMLSKDNNFVSSSYLFMFVFCVDIVLPSLFYVISPTFTILFISLYFVYNFKL